MDAYNGICILSQEKKDLCHSVSTQPGVCSVEKLSQADMCKKAYSFIVWEKIETKIHQQENGWSVMSSYSGILYDSVNTLQDVC